MRNIYTEKEFEKALKNRESQFVLKGPDAEKIVTKLIEAEQKKNNARNLSIGVGILCLLAAPFTAGTSLLGLGASVGAVVLSDAVICAIIAAVVEISKEAIRALRDYKLKKLDKESIEFTLK